MAIQGKDGAQPKKRIGEMLVQEGLIEVHHIQEALKVQRSKGGKTVEILINLGYLDVQDFAKFLARLPGIASIDLTHYRVLADICTLIPREYAVKNEVFPIDKMGKLLTVGMAFPLDSGTILELEEITGLRVKALLCSSTDIKASIERYYPEPDQEASAEETPATYAQIESAVKLGHAAGLVREIDKLPTLPETVEKVQRAAEDPEVSIKEVAEIVSVDPPIAANLLQLANSAAYGFPNRVDSVHLAATLLGLAEISQVVMSSAVIDLMQKTEGFEYQHFWKDANFSATAAKLIAVECGARRKAGVFTAGLLHDIGRFALWYAVPGRYAKVDQSLIGMDLVRAEEEVLGIAHPEAGYVLAENWQLPAEIVESIRFHHDPTKASVAEDMVAIVSLAASMAETQSPEDPCDDIFFERCGSAMTTLALDKATVTRLYEKALEMVDGD